MVKQFLNDYLLREGLCKFEAPISNKGKPRQFCFVQKWELFAWASSQSFQITVMLYTVMKFI